LDNILKRIQPKASSAAAVSEIQQPSVTERRAAPRFELRQLTSLYVTHRPLSTVIVDVSMTGARFATRMPWEVGSVLGITIAVDDTSMTLPLLVLWDRWAEGHFVNGGSFVALTPEEQAHLSRYVEHVQYQLGAETQSLETAALLAKGLMPLEV